MTAFWSRSQPERGTASVDRVRGVREHERQLLALAGGEVLQHEVRGVHPPRRSADADPDAVVVPRAERRRIDCSPLCPLSPPPQLEPEVAVRDVELVVDDDQLVGLDLEEPTAEATGPPDSFMYDRRVGQHARGRPGGPPAGEPALGHAARLVP